MASNGAPIAHDAAPIAAPFIILPSFAGGGFFGLVAAHAFAFHPLHGWIALGLAIIAGLFASLLLIRRPGVAALIFSSILLGFIATSVYSGVLTILTGFGVSQAWWIALIGGVGVGAGLLAALHHQAIHGEA